MKLNKFTINPFCCFWLTKCFSRLLRHKMYFHWSRVSLFKRQLVNSLSTNWCINWPYWNQHIYIWTKTNQHQTQVVQVDVCTLQISKNVYLFNYRELAISYFTYFSNPRICSSSSAFSTVSVCVCLSVSVCYELWDLFCIFLVFGIPHKKNRIGLFNFLLHCGLQPTKTS